MENEEINRKTLQQAIAECVTGATLDSVQLLTIREGIASTSSGSSNSISGGISNVFLRTLQSSGSSSASTTKGTTPTTSKQSALHSSSSSGESIIVSYVVTVPTILSAVNIAAQLPNAVQRGLFNVALRTYARDNGAVGLTTVSSGDVDTSPGDGSSSSNSVLSVGGIVGIAIAAVVVLVLLTVLSMYIYRTSKASTARVNPAASVYVVELPITAAHSP